MFKLDNNFLVELGLGTLPAEEKNKMLAHIYETLEMRVGMRLAEKMSNEQLDEFEAFINNNDEAGALKWLESNFPNYKQVVAEELEKLKAEIKQVAPQIVGQSQQSGGNAPIAQDPALQSAALPPGPPQSPLNNPVPNNFGIPAAGPAPQPMQSNMQPSPMFDPAQQPQFQQPLPPPPMPTMDPMQQPAAAPMPPASAMSSPMPPQFQSPLNNPVPNNFGIPAAGPAPQPMQSNMQPSPMFDPAQQPQFQQSFSQQQPPATAPYPPAEYQSFNQPVPPHGYDVPMNGNGFAPQPEPQFMQSGYPPQQNQFASPQPTEQGQPFPPPNDFALQEAPVYVPPSEGVTEIHHDTQQPTHPQVADQQTFSQNQQPPTVSPPPPLQFQPPVTPPKEPWQPPA